MHTILVKAANEKRRYIGNNLSVS